MASAFGLEGDRIDSYVVVALSDYLSIQIGDEALVCSDIERDRPIAVDVEEGLEGDSPPYWRLVALICPNPESAISQETRLVRVVKDCQACRVAGSKNDC